jgi:transposase-like protein
LCFADQRRGKEVGSVLLELTVAEQRFNAVMEVLRDGLTVVEVADRYGVSRQAVHGWLRRYASGGLDALADRSHRPRHCPHQMPAAVEAALCELRRRHPQWGQRRLAHELVRQGIDPPPGLTTTGGQLFTQDSPGVPGAAEREDAFGAALAAGPSGQVTTSAGASAPGSTQRTTS